VSSRLAARACGVAALLLVLALQRDARGAAALASIAGQAAKAIASGTVGGTSSPATLVVAAPLASDVQAPRGDELAARVAQLVAGAMGGATHASAQPASLAQARVLAGKSGARLVYVQPAIAKGALRVTLDAYPAMSNGWDRIRNPEPPPSAHAYAEAPVDAEVRAFLASIPLEHASVHRATHDEGDVLAAACGDLDGDGGMELVLVSRTRVASGHVNGGRFVPVKTAAWRALASRAPVPLREPLAGASIVRQAEDEERRGRGDGTRLLVGTTDRGGVALDPALLLVGALRGIPVPFVAAVDACASPNPEASAFDGAVTACAQGPAAAVTARSASLPPRFDGVAIADLVRADGSVRRAQAAREPNGKLQLRWGDVTQTLENVGAQIAVGDFDQDGAPEVATSSAEGDEAIVVTSWDGIGDPRPRLRLPAPGGVRALCVCPPEEGSVPALVAVVGSEVWIVR
jgi:hypothetical protein